MPSIRYLITAFLYFCATSFSFTALSLEGQWQCATRSGQYDDHTWYQINCSGTIIFHKNGMVESSCTDAFIPTGSIWQVKDQNLLLSDTEGQVFGQFALEFPDERTLILEKKGIKYTFDRVFIPRPAGG
jgi:hypothetical protein